MSQYHLSADGNPRPCKAQPGNCPVSGELEHFDNPDKAREYYEVVVQGGSFNRKKYRSHEERVAELPPVAGLTYEPLGDTADHVRDDGVPYSNVEIYRTNRSGKKISIALITIYDDDQVHAYDISDGLLSDIDAIEDLSDALHRKYKIIGNSSKAFYRPDDEPITVIRKTHAKRVEELPVVQGVVYDPEPWRDDNVTENGVAYSTVDAYRVGRTGKKSRIAQITVYDNGDAILWDKAEANEADIKARDKFATAVKKKYRLSDMSSPEFRS